MSNQVGGYMGRVFRVDLSRGQMTEGRLEETTLRKYVGGIGLGAKYLYEEVPPGVGCFDAENRLIFAAGPLSGTQVHGSSNLVAMGKGPLTNGAAASMANGFLAAYMKFSGFDAVIVQGASPKPVYLYLHDGIGELRDASHLAERDTIEIDEIIRRELGASGRQVSVLCTGPAAEKLVKFAGIIIDGAHSCSHNGLGAVMGSKRLKAIAVARGKASVAVKDPERLSVLNKEMDEAAALSKHFEAGTIEKDLIAGYNKYNWKTYDLIGGYIARGMLPIKNLTTSVLPDNTFSSINLRSSFAVIKRNPCWACLMHHSNHVRVTKGPYIGYEGKEPEYALMAMWGPNIGVTDSGTVVMLCNMADRLGLDVMESGWIISWVMECYEKGLIGKKDTGGQEMTWGNAEAVRAMLTMIAKREGFGDVLAEGLKSAAEHIGGEALNYAVYTQKGTTSGAHDERSDWLATLDIIVSNTGWREHRAFSRPADWGVPPLQDHFSPEEVPATLAMIKGAQQFYNSMGTCIFCVGCNPKVLTQMLSAATGWDFTLDEALQVGRRTVNLLRVFNIRHGLGVDQENPTPKYSSAPIDGPVKGKSIMPHWEYIRRNFYKKMGWHEETGKPLPETLDKLGLGYTVSDIWREEKHS